MSWDCKWKQKVGFSDLPPPNDPDSMIAGNYSPCKICFLQLYVQSLSWWRSDTWHQCRYGCEPGRHRWRTWRSLCRPPWQLLLDLESWSRAWCPTTFYIQHQGCYYCHYDREYNPVHHLLPPSRLSCTRIPPHSVSRLHSHLLITGIVIGLLSLLLLLLILLPLLSLLSTLSSQTVTTEWVTLINPKKSP